MKKVNLLLVLTLLLSCSKADPTKSAELCSGAALHTFIVPGESNDLSIELPTCFRLKILQGIDSSVGVFLSSEVSLEITYDIGGMAGTYVKADSPNKQVFQAVNQEFWYEFIDGHMCFTFPDAGPANFIVEGNDYFDDVLLVMKSVQSN